MRGSAIRTLIAAGRAPIIAAALFERTVQIWDWNLGERIAEFDTVFEHGGHRLALNPKGDCCVAASWKKGKRGGVVCYEARSGDTIWHRPDLRRVQGLRFSVSGDAVWCEVEGGPVQRLDSRTGATVAAMRAVRDVVDSPYSGHLLEVRVAHFVIKGVKDLRIPRLTFGLLDAAFSLTALCLSEPADCLNKSPGVVRCLECDTANERWRYQAPSGRHVLWISYRPDDSCFYGVQWDYERGGPVTLVRFSEESGASTEICRLNSFADSCCFAGGVVVTSAGDVVSVSEGKTLRQLPFPQCDYPDRPAPVSEPLLHFAARFGTIKTIENLVSDGADVNLADDSGCTPLHIAAVKGRLDVVNKLLELGADPRKQNDSSETAAQAAERVGQSEIARILSENST
jgi:hypothetical protein